MKNCFKDWSQSKVDQVLYIKICQKRPLKNKQNKGLNDKC